MANPQKADLNGTRPLHLAALHGQLEVVRVLVAAGAQKDTADQHGALPLHMAALNGETEPWPWFRFMLKILVVVTVSIFEKVFSPAKLEDVLLELFFSAQPPAFALDSCRAHTSCLLHHRGGGSFSSGGRRWTGCHGWLRCNSSAYRCRAWTRVTGPLFVGGESQCPKSQSTREDGTSYGSFEWSCGNTSVVSLSRRWDGVGWDWKVEFLKEKTDYCRTFFK